MAKYTKKWEKEFEKKYSDTISTLEALEKEYREMKESNPDKFISVFPETTNVELGEEGGFYVYDFGNDEVPHVDIQISAGVGSFNFTFNDLKDLIDLRNQLMKAIDTFRRDLNTEFIEAEEDDDDEDLEGKEEQEYEVKAERPCVESWTLTVRARSGAEALRKVQEDPDGEDVTSNYDSEYYDHGDIEYELI